jgi:hypothetical protein
MGLDHGSEPDLLGMLQGVGSISRVAPVAGSNQDGLNWFDIMKTPLFVGL